MNILSNINSVIKCVQSRMYPHEFQNKSVRIQTLSVEQTMSIIWNSAYTGNMNF